MLSMGDCVARQTASTKIKREDFVGFIYSLPLHEQEALVELARVTVKEMRDLDNVDHSALDEYHKMRRQHNEENELDSLFTRYALALSFFERWVRRGITSEREIAVALKGYGGEGSREQVSHEPSHLSHASVVTLCAVTTRGKSSTGYVSRLRCGLSVLAGRTGLPLGALQRIRWSGALLS